MDSEAPSPPAMDRKELTREELFALVWERPAREVAKDLGISDVALGKLCQRHQVPKPPRGYWAKVQAGQIPRKPPLLAYREDREIARKQQRFAGVVARLSKRQSEWLQRGLDVLAKAGEDINGCEMSHEGILAIPADLASKLIILIQNQYVDWVGGESAESSQGRQGAHQSVRGLVTKLLPLAASQVVAFQRLYRDEYERGDVPAILFRLTPALQQRICQLYHVVRDQRLSYVVIDLGSTDAAVSTRYLQSPNGFARNSSELCISQHEAWICCKTTTSWGEDTFETRRQPLQALVPVELIEPRVVDLSGVIRQTPWRSYAGRLQALRESEALYESLSSSVYCMENSVPDERLSIMDRLWFAGDKAPFSDARKAWTRVQEDLESWETVLEEERATLCREILGVRIGDVLVFEEKGKLVRIDLARADVFISEKDIHFHLSGLRYRKDGVLGKREEHFSLIVTNDL